MFTGLIEEIGIIKSVRHLGNARRLTIAASKIMNDIKIDDSISINGACQTVVANSHSEFEVETVSETLSKTTLGALKVGDHVNLERAMKLSDRLGGHIVQGHVDTVGTIISLQQTGISWNVWINFAGDYNKFLVNSGSICVDGVSLTTAKTEHNKFMIAVIPHTWESTIFKKYKNGTKVNLEFDILGKYIEKLTNSRSEANTSNLSYLIDQPEIENYR